MSYSSADTCPDTCPNFGQVSARPWLEKAYGPVYFRLMGSNWLGIVFANMFSMSTNQTNSLSSQISSLNHLEVILESLAAAEIAALKQIKTFERFYAATGDNMHRVRCNAEKAKLSRLQGETARLQAYGLVEFGCY